MNDVLTRGRTAVITGGASGIGLAAAEKFAQLGMNIAIADASSEDLDTALTVLNQSGVATRSGKLMSQTLMRSANFATKF